MNNRGFTMLEFMVASIIFMMIMIQVGSLWSSFYRWSIYVTGRTQLDSEVRLARNMIVRDIANTGQMLDPLDDVLKLQSYDSGDEGVVFYRNDDGLMTRESISGVDMIGVSKYLSTSQYSIEQEGISKCTLAYTKNKSTAGMEIIVSKIQSYQGQ